MYYVSIYIYIHILYTLYMYKSPECNPLVHRKLFKYDWVNKGITGQSPVGVDLHWHWRTRALSWRRKWGSPRWAPVTAKIGLRLRLYSFLCIFPDEMYTYIIVYIYIYIYTPYIYIYCIYIYIMLLFCWLWVCIKSLHFSMYHRIFWGP